MKRVLVTGGSGFIGTNLVQHHIERGDTVRSLDIAPPACAHHRTLWRSSSILDAGALAGELQKFQPTHVYHFAARTDLNGRSVADYPANTVGVSNVIDAVAHYGKLERIFFASSRLVCRIGHQPKDDRDYSATTAYGRSKIQGEELVRATGNAIPWTIVRPTSIWGEWFGVPYKNFFLTIRDGKYVHPSGPDIRKSFGYVGNSVYQLAELLSADSDATAKKTFYIADYPPLYLREFANKIREAFGGPRINTAPRWLLRAGGHLGDLTRSIGNFQPPITSFRISNLLTDMVYDLSSVEAIVGPLPFSMDDGVLRTVAWLRSASRDARNHAES